MPPSPRFHTDPGDPHRYSARLRLAALPTAVPTARRFVRDRLHRWHLAALAGNCELVTSELVTNALIATGSRVIPACYTDLHDHTPATIVVRLRVTTKLLFSEVWDRSEDPPVPKDPAEIGEMSEDGRGLLLVAALATDWNWYLSGSAQGGKVVWSSWALPT